MKPFLILICLLIPGLFKTQTLITHAEQLAKAKPDEVLKVQLTQVKSFPEQILAFKNLRELEITASELTGIPNEICRLKHLESIDFSHCPNIRQIPDSIGLLANLKTMNFLMTNVTTLPESIGRLSQLQFINLGYCRVKEFPASFYKLRNLKSMTIGFREADPPLFTDEELAELRKKLPHCKICY